MKSLLIAGAGYVGQELLRQASRAGWQVFAISRHAETLDDGKGNRLQIDDVDFSDPAALASYAEKVIPQPTAIVHCASSGRGGAEAFRKVFLNGTQNLQRQFPQAQLIFTSSTSVYHQTDGSCVDETSLTEPSRETSQILLEAEKLFTGKGGIVTRLGGLYGPERSHLVKKFLAHEAVIEGDGQRILNQLHRTDAASAILHLLSIFEQRSGETYNVCDFTPLKQLEAYQALAKHFEQALPPQGEANTNRKRAWTNKAVSAKKIHATGWEPRYPSFLDALCDL